MRRATADQRRRWTAAPGSAPTKAQPTAAPQCRQSQPDSSSSLILPKCLVLLFRVLLFRSALHRRLQFLAQCRKKSSDQMLRDAAQDSLTNAGNQPTDFANTLKAQAGCVGSFRRNFEARVAVAVAECTGAGHLDAAGGRRHLVRQRDLAFEGTTDGRDAELHLDLV